LLLLLLMIAAACFLPGKTTRTKIRKNPPPPPPPKRLQPISRPSKLRHRRIHRRGIIPRQDKNLQGRSATAKTRSSQGESAATGQSAQSAKTPNRGRKPPEGPPTQGGQPRGGHPTGVQPTGGQPGVPPNSEGSRSTTSASRRTTERWSTSRRSTNWRDNRPAVNRDKVVSAADSLVREDNPARRFSHAAVKPINGQPFGGPTRRSRPQRTGTPPRSST